MTTPKRVAANRRNAGKSTGPKSTRGKARSRLNALKHGFDATLPVLLGEDGEAYRRRLDAWTGHLAPLGPVELYLVQRAVHVSWQLDRAERCLLARLAEADRPGDADSESSETTRRADRLAFDDSESGERLRRYQLACGRMLIRTLDALARLRSAFDAARPEGTRLEPDMPQAQDQAKGPAIGPATNGQGPAAEVGEAGNSSGLVVPRSAIEQILAEILARVSKADSVAAPTAPVGQESATSASAIDETRSDLDAPAQPRDVSVEPTTPADRRDPRIGIRSSHFLRRVGRDASKPEWPDARPNDLRQPSATNSVHAPVRRSSQDHEACPNEPALRRRVGGYEVPLDQWAPVSGADKAPVRLRRHSTRNFAAPASECTAP